MPCHARDKGKSTRYCTEASQERYGHVRQVCMHVHSLARNSRPGNTACARPGASAVGWTQSATTLRVSARTCMKATDVDSHWFQVICDRLFLPCIDPWARNPRGGRPWVFVLHEDRPIAQWRCTLGFTIGHSWLGWSPAGLFGAFASCKLQATGRSHRGVQAGSRSMGGAGPPSVADVISFLPSRGGCYFRGPGWSQRSSPLAAQVRVTGLLVHAEQIGRGRAIGRLEAKARRSRYGERGRRERETRYEPGELNNACAAGRSDCFFVASVLDHFVSSRQRKPAVTL